MIQNLEIIPMRSIIFKPFYWYAEDEEEDNEHITYVAGRTPENKSVMVKILNFTPYIYLELPSNRTWTKNTLPLLFNHFQKIFRKNAPNSYKIAKKRNLYHLTPMNIMILTFPTFKAMKIFSYKMRSSRFVVPGIGSIAPKELIPHESNFPSELKFTTTRNIFPSDWIQVDEFIPEEEKDLDEEDRKFSINDIDLCCDWKTVRTPDEDYSHVILSHKYMSFDIECHSENPNSKLPDPKEPKNEVFQISSRFGSFNSKEPQRRVLFTLFDMDDIEDVEIVKCKSEADLLVKFSKVTQEENPDMYVGYNIMKFDWQYLIRRAEMLHVYNDFVNLSRLSGVRAFKDITKWHSAAYGTQEFEYIHSHGRMNVDLLPEIERSYKLPTYSLNAVSEHFLKENKDDVTPKQLFMLFKLVRDFTKEFNEIKKLTKEYLIDFRRRIKLIIPPVLVGSNPHVKDLKRDLLKAKSLGELKRILKRPLWITGMYCDQDTNLPIRLMKTLNMLTAMEAMSNVCNVPMSYLHTRGQQIKVIGQFMRNTIKEGLVIPLSESRTGQKYQGATVIEAIAGDYDNIVTWDFASLYPSQMISNNICYTTLVVDEKVPDEECYIIEWEEHRYCGCPKDVFAGKKCSDKKKIFCSDHRYRFYKPIIEPDGTRSREGLLPRMERNMLSERKKKKKEMAKWDAVVAMNRGHATAKDIAFYRKKGYEIIEKESLSEKEDAEADMKAGVANAEQLALKVSANSMYGILGASKGYIPLIEGAASVTAMGRFMINKAIDYIIEKYPNIKLVYGDTDSCMMNIAGVTDLHKLFDLAENIGAETTHYLKCLILKLEEETYYDFIDGKRIRIDKIGEKDIVKMKNDCDKVMVWQYLALFLDLEFENVYGRYLLLTKKRYVAYSVNRDGEIIKVTKKGVVLARRDNSKYLRDAYSKLITHVLDAGSEKDFMNMLYDSVHKLFTRQLSITDFVIYMGVKNVVEYAKKKKIQMANGDEIEMFVSSVDGSLFDDPIGWDDDRLIYPNIPQCLLSLKMIGRGTSIPANTRLEFLYIENRGAEHQGEKAEDFTYFKENKEEKGLKVDALHYLEKQLSKPVTELLGVKYPREKVLHEKIEDKFKRLIEETGNRLVEHRIVKHKKVMDRIDFIIHSSKKVGEINEIGDSYPELVKCAKAYKSKLILDKIYKRFGLRKRLAKRPGGRGETMIEIDGTVMKDLLKYRTYYRDVVGELNGMFNTEIVFE